MLRGILTFWFALTTLVGPGMCCCTLQPIAATKSICCCGQTSSSDDTDRPLPTKCPCQGHCVVRDTVAVAGERSPVIDDPMDSFADACFKPVVYFVPTVILAARHHSIAPAGRELLSLYHILRC